MPTQIAVDDRFIAGFCQRNHIRKLSLFGSVLTGEFSPDSDIDVLVDFDPQYSVGFRIFDMEEELARAFGGHRVDIINAKYINPRMKEKVFSEAEVHYAQG
jgi:uncharacterized protein